MLLFAENLIYAKGLWALPSGSLVGCITTRWLQYHFAKHILSKLQHLYEMQQVPKQKSRLFVCFWCPSVGCPGLLVSTLCFQPRYCKRTWAWKSQQCTCHPDGLHHPESFKHCALADWIDLQVNEWQLVFGHHSKCYEDLLAVGGWLAFVWRTMVAWKPPNSVIELGMHIHHAIS